MKARVKTMKNGEHTSRGPRPELRESDFPCGFTNRPHLRQISRRISFCGLRATLNSGDASDNLPDFKLLHLQEKKNGRSMLGGLGPT